MLELLEKIWPIIITACVYVVRLEVTMAKISSDLCWIKKKLEQLQ
jgi:hypothetical protein